MFEADDLSDPFFDLDPVLKTFAAIPPAKVHRGTLHLLHHASREKKKGRVQ
jgi:hypothetical protein